MVAVLLLNTASTGKIGDYRAIMAIVAELFAIPTFWFGGPWISTSFLNLIPLDEMILPYVVTLAIVFVVIVGYPASRLIIRIGNEFAG